MRRADRLFQIVQFLRGGRLVKAKTLAQKLEVSTRTIYRDIADLVGSGVPIDGEAGVGYIMREGYDIPPMMFNHDEIVALVAGARLMKGWGGKNMALAAEEALIKIQSVLPKNTKNQIDNVGVYSVHQFGLSEKTRERLDQIEQAEQEKTELKIHYCDQEGKSTQRIILPLGLFYWGKVWTLVAWCELRDDFRTFRVDRITKISQGTKFSPHPDRSLKKFLEIEHGTICDLDNDKLFNINA